MTHVKKVKMIYGTSYFASTVDAQRYYKDYGYDNVVEAVAEKIKSGEIHTFIKPSLKPNETGEYDKDGRFQVTVWE